MATTNITIYNKQVSDKLFITCWEITKQLDTIEDINISLGNKEEPITTS